MDLGDRVLGPALRTEAVVHGLKSASKIGSSTSLRAACTVRSRRRDAQATALAGFGITRSRTGRGTNRLALRSLVAARNIPCQRDSACHPIDPGVVPLVAPHPIPRHDEERRIGDEVEQVIEATVRIVGRPLVQLGLDPQYSQFGLDEVGHGAPVFTGDLLAPHPLRSRWAPSPCARLCRVAPAHCCAGAPSEPDVRLSPHPAQASPEGVAGVQRCWPRGHRRASRRWQWAWMRRVTVRRAGLPHRWRSRVWRSPCG